jgi:tetratricopeptide (TPR) repeat protein
MRCFYALTIALWGLLFWPPVFPTLAEETTREHSHDGAVYEEDLPSDRSDEAPSASVDEQTDERAEDPENEEFDEEQAHPSPPLLPAPLQEERTLPETVTRDAPSPPGLLPSFPFPPPAETPPFLSRPSEWEVSPPTVTGIPSLPAPTSLSAPELIALSFVEDGKALLDQQDQEGARELFERAIGIAPLQPYSYYFLGRIAFARGDHKQAIAFLQKAELLFASVERAWLGETTSLKGTVYEDLQDYKHARAAYRRSLRFEPANLKVLSALARLPEEELPPSDPAVP